MQKQKGGALVIVLALLGIFMALAAVVVVMFISANNAANRAEETIKATHRNNQNVLAQYHQKVLEAAQVPDMAREDLIKVATATLEGRYGPDGSQAMFQMITEQNHNVDPALYTKLQQIVEAGRDEFKNNQTRLLDTKKVYTTALGSFPRGAIMGLMGWPRINLDDYDIVITEGVEQTFRSGKEVPLKLRAAP